MGKRPVCPGFAAVCPVVDMVTIDETLIDTSGEAATFVAGVQSAPEWGGDGACFASDVKRIAVFVLYDSDHARIARQTPARFRGNARSVLDLAATGSLLSTRFPHGIPFGRRGNVDDDLIPIASNHFVRAVRQKAFGH